MKMNKHDDIDSMNERKIKREGNVEIIAYALIISMVAFILVMLAMAILRGGV